jgi:hypothetical protein
MGRGTSCATRAEIGCPGLLFREESEEFKLTGIMVPRGIFSWADTAKATNPILINSNIS